MTEPNENAAQDPRSPVRKLLDLYVLDEEREQGLNQALLAAEKEWEGGNAASAAGHIGEALAAYAAGAALGPSAVGGASGADAQISLPKTPFHDWHLSPGCFPDEYDIPLRVPLADAIAVSLPVVGAFLDDENSDNEPPTDEDSWWTRFWRGVHEAQSQFEHSLAIAQNVEDRVSKIKAARALMPVIPEGKTAGTLQKVNYTTVIGGRDSADSGWMFAEPANSEYGLWFAGQMRKRYDDAVAGWNSMPDSDPAAKKRAWGAVGSAATCIAIAGQEAAPSGINTYDGRVLSWGIGLAAPGLLQKVMKFIVDDPKVRKVFYCCGFSYGCDVRAVKGSNDQYHGIYQTVDLTMTKPAIVYGDNFVHRNIPRKQKKGDMQGNGYLALKAFTAQKELIYMLIQVARDPETRDTCFKHNYNFIQGAAGVKGFVEIESEALYVFIAQVQHNWGIASQDPVGYAIRTMDAAEKALPRPSAEADKAIAKGVVRLVAKVLQEQRFQNAVKAFKTKKYPGTLRQASLLWEFPATTEWGPQRMLDHYWMRLQRGERSQDRSKVEVPGFMVPVLQVPPGNYMWRGRRADDPSYDLGPASRMDLRFEHDEFFVSNVRTDKKVEMVDKRTGQVRIEDPNPR